MLRLKSSTSPAWIERARAHLDDLLIDHAQCEKNADFFCPGTRAGHFHFDIKGYAARRLALAGLKEIQCLPCDTCAEESRFFSYRRSCLRGEKDYGRGLSAASNGGCASISRRKLL